MAIPLLPLLLDVAFGVVFFATLWLTNRRACYGTAILALLSPFDFPVTVVSTTVTWPKVALLAVCASLIFAHGFRRFDLRGARLTLLGFTCIVIAIGLSAIPATDRGETVRELLKWLEYSLIFTVAFAAYRIDPDDTILRRALSVTIALVCGTAISQDFYGATSVIAFGAGIAPRIAGALEGPNQLAAYLEVAACMLLAWRTRSPSIALAALLAFVGVTLTLTFSRGGLTGTLAGAIAIVMLNLQNWFALVAPLLFGCIAGGIVDTGWYWAARTLPALHNPKYGSSIIGGVGTRGELWRAALYFFERHPLLGIGAGNFEERLPEAGLIGVRTHANSWYLQAMAEGGITLLSATLLFIASILATLRTALKRSPWVLGAFAATIALAMHQIVDYVVFYPKVATLWLIVVGTGTAAATAPCEISQSH